MRVFKFCVILSLSFLLWACKDITAVEPPLPPQPIVEPITTIAITPEESSVSRGERFSHSISINLDDPSGSVTEAVMFLNVLRVISDEDGLYEPVLPYFSEANTTNNIFNTPISGDLLREGVLTELSYIITEEAPIGTYNINIQMFEGNETNPAKVTVEQRIGITNTRFTVQ